MLCVCFLFSFQKFLSALYIVDAFMHSCPAVGFSVEFFGVWIYWIILRIIDMLDLLVEFAVDLEFEWFYSPETEEWSKNLVRELNVK